MFILLLLLSTLTCGEDIELYVSDAVKQANQKTQVLIIFDNSGSMGTVESVKVSYDPNEDYPALDGYTAAANDYIYYNKGDSIAIPDDSDEKRRFLSSLNSCESAKSILATTGMYTGHIRRYKFEGNTGTWKNIPRNNGSNISVLDCENDVLNNNATNIASIPQGFPVNNQGDLANPIYHTADVDDSNVTWSGALITLYTDNYLRWYHGIGSETIEKTRMAMAKESISNVINSAPSIDFGLQVFNYNDGDSSTDPNGGRIVFGIDEMTSANKTTFLDIVNNQLTAETWTPLCESLYEASLYFAGKSVDFGDGDEDVGDYDKNTPARDQTIEKADGKYKTPLTSCHAKAYVILITDGEPTYDNGADSKIEALSVVEDGSTVNFSGSKVSSNYLAGLAEWMSEHDINADLDGKQSIDTYTIGFSSGADDAEPLLKEAARLGGGLYFKAQDSVQLTAALLGALQNIEPSNDSLTSASVAANNFDRTETLNAVYYAMFQPQNGPRWQGNLKKYKVVNNAQVGQGSVAALDASSGHFNENVTSFWSEANSKDGNVVADGGVADMLRKMDVDDRVIYSDIGTLDSLVLFNDTNVAAKYTDQDAFATTLGVATDEIASTLNWARGMDVDNEDGDNSSSDTRSDIFGDPLHSKPLVVNYGDSIRIVIGTNAGALHMFEDNADVVTETWTFMPKEFFPKIKLLRENFSTADKVYGIDGKITSYILDKNGDGIVNGTDKVWIFFGLRRGGSSYYALDISSPTTPSLLWHIDDTTSGFSELGQSWSQPKIAYSKINTSGSGDSALASPVMIFGGGYDTSKDSTGPGTNNDSSGRAIYMVDAATGTLKWSLAPSGGTTTFTGVDSIASSIATLDSNGDGLTDRLYTGDTGGNVWRIDMPDKLPNDSDDPWTVFKLGSFGGTTNATDRRFFNEASIVRTFISETLETTITDEHGAESKYISRHEKPYDAVLIGSGDRSNPLGKDTTDTLIMIKDVNIRTQSFSGSTTPSTPSAITISDLYNYTDNPFDATLTTTARETLEVAVSEKSGWYVDLDDTGEKSSSSAIVINGVVYFTSFIPPAEVIDAEACEVPNGQGWLYAIDLALGTKVYDWDDSENPDGITDGDERKVYISEQFLGAPTLIVLPEDDGDENTVDDSVGNIIVGREIIPVGFSLETLRTNLYVTENQ